jgi:hypothetical protein
MSRIRGPHRRPWQPPLPDPVIRLMSSLVCAPSSRAFQKMRFLIPLQIHTTFMPSKSVRDSAWELAENSWLSSCIGWGGGDSCVKGEEGSTGVCGDGADGASQSGMSRPSAAGSRPERLGNFLLAGDEVACRDFWKGTCELYSMGFHCAGAQSYQPFCIGHCMLVSSHRRGGAKLLYWTSITLGRSCFADGTSMKNKQMRE